MCEYCKVNQPTLAEALLPFLREGIRASVRYDDNGAQGAEDIYLDAEDGTYLVITAGGAGGGYFHWEATASDESLLNQPGLGENVIHLADYR